MKPIIISAIIATGFHIMLMAFIPPFSSQSDKILLPETKSVFVAISYRPPKIKKIPFKPDKPEKEIRTISKIKKEPRSVKIISFTPTKKTRALIKKKKPAKLPGQVKENKPVIQNQKDRTKKSDTVKGGQENSIKAAIKKNIPDQARTFEKTVPHNKGYIKTKETIKPKEIIKPKENRIEFAKPLYKENTLPAYPIIAQKRGYHGIVELMVLVSEKGAVSSIKIFKSSKYKSLDRQAIKTVKTWLFEPGKKNGTPEETWVKIPVKFELN